jgi:hypothetical protein
MAGKRGLNHFTTVDNVENQGQAGFSFPGKRQKCFQLPLRSR